MGKAVVSNIEIDHSQILYALKKLRKSAVSSDQKRFKNVLRLWVSVFNVSNKIFCKLLRVSSIMDCRDRKRTMNVAKKLRCFNQSQNRTKNLFEKYKPLNLLLEILKHSFQCETMKAVQYLLQNLILTIVTVYHNNIFPMTWQTYFYL